MTNTSGTMADPQARSDTAPLRAKSGWIIALGVVYLIAGFIAMAGLEPLYSRPVPWHRSHHGRRWLDRIGLRPAPRSLRCW